MSKNLTFILLMTLIFSCKNEPSETSSTAAPAAQATNTEEKEKSAEEAFAELKANAFDEDDKFGRVNHSLGLVQKQFDLSNRLRPQDGTRTIFVDERFTIIVRHEKDGKVKDQKINLINLDHKNGGMHLIPDVKADDLPGFAISVREGFPGVQILENDKKIGEERELRIFMNDRTLIEASVPAFLQALNVIHGRN